MMQVHVNHGKEATLCVKAVEDPSKYSVVVSQDSGLVTNFVDRPKEFISNKVNTGVYLFNTSLLSKIKPRPSSLEADLLPRLTNENNLYCMELDGFWMDIGLPHNYLLGTELYL